MKSRILISGIGDVGNGDELRRLGMKLVQTGGDEGDGVGAKCAAVNVSSALTEGS